MNDADALLCSTLIGSRSHSHLPKIKRKWAMPDIFRVRSWPSDDVEEKAKQRLWMEWSEAPAYRVEVRNGLRKICSFCIIIRSLSISRWISAVLSGSFVKGLTIFVDFAIFLCGREEHVPRHKSGVRKWEKTEMKWDEQLVCLDCDGIFLGKLAGG